MAVSGHNQTLRWSDFPGTPPAGETLDAYTSSTYNLNWGFAPGRTDEYRLANISVAVVLRRAQMWSRRSAQSARLLKHEQGHYDIVAMTARDLSTDLTALASQVFTSESDLRDAVNDLDRAARSQIVNADSAYDTQTDHGNIATAQASWDAAFRAARGGTRFLAALTAQGISI